MPFANIKASQVALSRAQKAGHPPQHRAVRRVFWPGSTAASQVLVKDVPDGGYGRADEVLMIRDPYRVPGSTYKEQGAQAVVTPIALRMPPRLRWSGATGCQTWRRIRR